MHVWCDDNHENKLPEMKINTKDTTSVRYNVYYTTLRGNSAFPYSNDKDKGVMDEKIKLQIISHR